jgi:hypothetical protein
MRGNAAVGEDRLLRMPERRLGGDDFQPEDGLVTLAGSAWHESPV